MQLFVDNWSAVLLAPITDTATEILVDPAAADRLVGLGGGDFYELTLVEIGDTRLEVDWEIITVTAAAGGTLAVAPRTGRAWGLGSPVYARLTAAALEALRDAAAGGGGGESPPARFGPPRVPIGGSIGINAIHTAAGSIGFLTDKIRIAPFELAAPMSIDQLSIRVFATSASSGRLLRIAIYSSDADGWPSSLLQVTGDLSGETAGLVAADIVPLDLEAGQVYWAGVQVNANYNLLGFNSGTILSAALDAGQPALSLEKSGTWAGGPPEAWAYSSADFSLFGPAQILMRRCEPAGPPE